MAQIHKAKTRRIMCPVNKSEYETLTNKLGGRDIKFDAFFGPAPLLAIFENNEIKLSDLHPYAFKTDTSILLSEKEFYPMQVDCLIDLISVEMRYVLNSLVRLTRPPAESTLDKADYEVLWRVTSIEHVCNLVALTKADDPNVVKEVTKREIKIASAGDVIDHYLSMVNSLREKKSSFANMLLEELRKIPAYRSEFNFGLISPNPFRNSLYEGGQVYRDPGSISHWIKPIELRVPLFSDFFISELTKPKQSMEFSSSFQIAATFDEFASLADRLSKIGYRISFSRPYEGRNYVTFVCGQMKLTPQNIDGTYTVCFPFIPEWTPEMIEALAKHNSYDNFKVGDYVYSSSPLALIPVQELNALGQVKVLNIWTNKSILKKATFYEVVDYFKSKKYGVDKGRPGGDITVQLGCTVKGECLSIVSERKQIRNDEGRKTSFDDVAKSAASMMGDTIRAEAGETFLSKREHKVKRIKLLTAVILDNIKVKNTIDNEWREELNDLLFDFIDMQEP